MKLLTPHVPLGIAESDARALLGSMVLVARSDGSLGFSLKGAEIVIHVANGVVSSVWYDDPTGRTSSAGREAKVAAYLSRYGDMDAWECRMDNGWMRYWFNSPAHAAMVYGLDRDVIRFNLWHDPNNDD